MLDKIVLGTMKLKNNFSNSSDLTNFLNYAFENGIKQLHVSNEYESYKILVKSLQKIKERKYTIIIKLSESKKDQIKFSLKRFEQKINKYRSDLGQKHDYIVQLVNRYKCNDPKKYLLHEQQTFDILKPTVTKLKKINKIKSFYFFPYHKNIINIKRQTFIDGITIYRNLYEKRNDNYAIQNKYKIIAMRTFGGNEKKINKINLKKLINYNLNSKIVKKVIVGTNNKFQLDELLKVC